MTINIITRFACFSQSICAVEDKAAHDESDHRYDKTLGNYESTSPRVTRPLPD